MNCDYCISLNKKFKNVLHQQVYRAFWNVTISYFSVRMGLIISSSLPATSLSWLVDVSQESYHKNKWCTLKIGYTIKRIPFHFGHLELFLLDTTMKIWYNNLQVHSHNTESVHWSGSNTSALSSDLNHLKLNHINLQKEEMILSVPRLILAISFMHHKQQAADRLPVHYSCVNRVLTVSYWWVIVP